MYLSHFVAVCDLVVLSCGHDMSCSMSGSISTLIASSSIASST
jgi:hypothetical protein